MGIENKDLIVAFVALPRLVRAVESLERFHPFFGITFLSMKESGISTDVPREWGSAQENALLTRFYQPPGGTPSKPFFTPFLGPDQDHGKWKNPKYSGGSLQRGRTSGKIAEALVHPDKKNWQFAKDYLPKLEDVLPKDAARKPIKVPLNDMIAWMYREDDLPANFDEVQQLFIQQFKLSEIELQALFDTLPESDSSFFFSEKIPDEEVVALTGGVPAGVSLRNRTEQDLLDSLVKHIRDEELLVLPDGFVQSIYFSLKSQPFLVLAGHPGTGKTAFARALTRALSSYFGGSVNEVVVGIGRDFTEADVVGYEKISGELAPTELTRKLLMSGRAKDMYIVVLDEMNLSDVDSYLARILPALESGIAVSLPGGGEPVQLPPDTYVIGTINSYLEEASRLPLSGPVKRRANIVEMPNHLSQILASGSRAAFELACNQLVRQSRQRLVSRSEGSFVSVFDGFRLNDYDSALGEGGKLGNEEFRTSLWSICEACMSGGSSLLTMGILQDVLDYVLLSGEPTLVALDRQIARKIVPQLSGNRSAAESILATLGTLDNNEAIFTESRASVRELLDNSPFGSSGNVQFKY